MKTGYSLKKTKKISNEKKRNNQTIRKETKTNFFNRVISHDHLHFLILLNL